MITLQNARKKLEEGGVIQMERLYWQGQRYRLLKNVHIQMSNGTGLTLREGFVWDLSSSPRFLWAIFPPDGDFQLASLIHDALYKSKKFDRKFADKEMLLWSKAVNGTRKISIKNFDNHSRYIAVRLFGWIVWNRKK